MVIWLNSQVDGCFQLMVVWLIGYVVGLIYYVGVWLTRLLDGWFVVCLFGLSVK